jgi:hypothetical protein
MTELLRFDLGFVGGGSTSGSITEEEWDRLAKAMAESDGAMMELPTEGARLFVRPSQVAWARLHVRETRVGF